MTGTQVQRRCRDPAGLFQRCARLSFGKERTQCRRSSYPHIRHQGYTGTLRQPQRIHRHGLGHPRYNQGGGHTPFSGGVFQGILQPLACKVELILIDYNRKMKNGIKWSKLYTNMGDVQDDADVGEEYDELLVRND